MLKMFFIFSVADGLETRSFYESLHAVDVEVSFCAGAGDGGSSVLDCFMTSLMPHVMSNATKMVMAPMPK